MVRGKNIEMVRNPTSPLDDTGVLEIIRHTGDNWLLKQESSTCSNNLRSLGRAVGTLPDVLIKKERK